MKKYTIIQTVPSTQIWTYEVDANSEEEAMEIVKSSEVECSDYEVEEDGYFGIGEFIVQDVEDSEEE